MLSVVARSPSRVDRASDTFRQDSYRRSKTRGRDRVLVWLGQWLPPIVQLPDTTDCERDALRAYSELIRLLDATLCLRLPSPSRRQVTRRPRRRELLPGYRRSPMLAVP